MCPTGFLVTRQSKPRSDGHEGHDRIVMRTHALVASIADVVPQVRLSGPRHQLRDNEEVLCSSSSGPSWWSLFLAVGVGTRGHSSYGSDAAHLRTVSVLRFLSCFSCFASGPAIPRLPRAPQAYSLVWYLSG